MSYIISPEDILALEFWQSSLLQFRTHKAARALLSEEVYRVKRSIQS